MKIPSIYNFGFKVNPIKQFNRQIKIQKKMSHDSYINNISGISSNIIFRARSVYSVDKDGNYKKYESVTELSEDMDIPRYTIYLILSGKQKSVREHTFAYSDDVEKICLDKSNGEAVVDDEMIENLRKKTSEKMIYAIDKEGNYKKFKDISSASCELGILPSAIFRILKFDAKTANGYTFAYANNIETKGADGNIIVNKENIEKYRCIASLKRVYAISSDGTYKRYESATDAANSTGIKKSMISLILCGNVKNTQGYNFVWANDVETVDDEGKVVVNKSIISEYIPPKKKND